MIRGSSKAAAVTVLSAIFLACVSSHYVPCSPAVPKATCPRDTLKFVICLVTEVIGTKPSPECCTLVEGIADLEAAVCLCTALKANVLGAIKLDVPIALSLLVNGCGKKLPDGFKC